MEGMAEIEKVMWTLGRGVWIKNISMQTCLSPEREVAGSEGYGGIKATLENVRTGHV